MKSNLDLLIASPCLTNGCSEVLSDISDKSKKIGLVCLLYISSSSKLNHFYPNKDELWLHSS